MRTGTRGCHKGPKYKLYCESGYMPALYPSCAQHLDCCKTGRTIYDLLTDWTVTGVGVSIGSLESSVPEIELK